MLQTEGAYAVLTRATQLEQKGQTIIHFEIGQPDFPTPQNISEAAIKAIRKGFTKYTPPLGIMSLRKRIAEEISKARNLDISEKQIAITPSGKTALFIAFSALIEPGDEVIYPDPGFPTYPALVDYYGGVKKPVPLSEKNNFSFDMEIFRKKFSQKTKLIVLNSPSNPTGGVLPLGDLKQIADMAKRNNCWVITDEMYSRIVYPGLKYPSYYGLKKVQSQTMLVDGFSKTYSMTGWRIGYLSAPIGIMNKIDCLLTHTVGCTASFTQYAALEALNGSQDEVFQMVKEFQKRRDFVVAELNKIKGISCQKPPGAFYAFPNIKAFKKTSKWMADFLLDKVGVALLDGTSFGKQGEGYLRISYATSIKNLKEGTSRIKQALAKL